MSGKPLVLDASIVIKALLEEEHSRESRTLMASAERFLAPDLMPIEFGNVLWKKVQRGGLEPEAAGEAQQALLTLAPIRILPSAGYQPRALVLALGFGRSFYDALYLALAEAEGGLLVTANERFVRAMDGTPLASSIHWIGKGIPSGA